MNIYIYSLTDPITNEIRYIGKTGNIHNRLLAHISKSKTSNTHVGRWIKSLLNKGLLPILDIVEECPSSIWETREIYWISYYKSLYPNLCNIQKGGNQPVSIKKKIQKYSIKHNKYVVVCSYNNTTYYLGSFTSKKEATNMYDQFQENPLKYIENFSRTFNTSGVNMYKNDKLIKSFDTISECAKYLNTHGSLISRVCRNKSKQHLGYTFRYKLQS